MKQMIIMGLVSVCALSACSQVEQTVEDSAQLNYNDMDSEDKVIKTDEEWQAELTPEEYEVLRLKGTEVRSTGEYDKFFEEGTYVCAACGAALFTSDTKYDSGSGWPAFYDAADATCVRSNRDSSYGMVRTEVLCNKCDGHLGHVFEDGPDPTGLRYCVNSISLDFIPKNEE